MFTMNDDTWATPASFMDVLHARFGEFDLDPCCVPATAKAPWYFTPEVDGLMQPWHGKVFMNPPYGRGIGNWVAKAHMEGLSGAQVYCLIPARTDTTYWHDYVMTEATWVGLIRGRLRFERTPLGRGHNAAPFPSAVVLFDGGYGPPSFSSLERELETA